MVYIEEEITDLSCNLNTLWDRFCKLERAVEDLTERVSEIHDMVIHDEPQVQQTTEEFVRIVRCKDCKNYMEYDASRPHCYEDGRIVMPNDFCSWGIIKDKNLYEVSDHE